MPSTFVSNTPPSRLFDPFYEDDYDFSIVFAAAMAFATGGTVILAENDCNDSWISM
jgi:hypothetical protein